MMSATHPARACPIRHTAVLVVDMQNDFGAERGHFHRAGIDISGIREVIAPTARVLAAARSVGIPVVYIKAGIRPDLSDIGARALRTATGGAPTALARR